MAAIEKHLALSMLKSELPLVYGAISGGWTAYLDQYPAAVKVVHTTRTRRSIVHDHIVDQAMQLFGGRIGVECMFVQKLFVVSFNNGIAIRFKKLDEKLRSSNIPTQQSIDFVEQSELPEIGSAYFLQAGYQLNSFESEISGIYLTCPSGSSSNFWDYKIESGRAADNGENVVNFPRSPTSGVLGSGVKIVPKQGTKNDEASES
jgi:hypothetical protein